MKQASMCRTTIAQYKWCLLSLLATGIAIRAATSLSPYSGESTPPMYGDFEAQRHWMEITLHLPPSHWYQNTSQNNISYWGLDYPPLSAYLSYAFANLVKYVDSHALALHTSHGYQTPKIRAVMRVTVILVDLFLFFPALLLLITHLHRKHLTHIPMSHNQAVFMTLAFCLTLPPLIIVDHAHFQYNNFSLALFLLSLTSFLNANHSLGAVFFCTAVYFKHMSLYFAIAIFAYLLAQMTHKLKHHGLLSAFNFAATILFAISAITVAVFSPWLNDKELLLGVFRRLFPLARGLYEDKVANVWCSISILIKLNVLLPRDKLFIFCAGVTFLASLPFCVAVFLKPSPVRLILSTCGCSLSAFLFSYQVHEKQILIPLLPLALLHPLYPTLSMWMSLTASFSLFPLLLREHSTTAYAATMILHVSVTRMMSESMDNGRHPYQPRSAAIVSIMVGCMLNLALIFATPPIRAPDLFVLANTTYACLHLCILYLILLYQVFVS